MTPPETFAAGFVFAQGPGEGTGVPQRVMDGAYMGEGGQQIMIQQQANNQIRLEVGGVGVDCDCNMTQERVQNQTKLFAKLSNGKNAEIKVMPDVASERALERLRLKVCSEENSCQIELKETRSGNQTKAVYEVQAQKQSKLFGLFNKKMRNYLLL